MRLRAVTRIGLKSPNSLSHDIPSVLRRTVNVSERVQGVSIFPDCVRVGVLLGAHSSRTDSMGVWSLAKVFHTCGKNCGKSTRIDGLSLFQARNRTFSPMAD